MQEVRPCPLLAFRSVVKRLNSAVARAPFLGHALTLCVRSLVLCCGVVVADRGSTDKKTGIMGLFSRLRNRGKSDDVGPQKFAASTGNVLAQPPPPPQ